MVRRTKQQALATRDQILDAAETLFQQRGVSRTTLHDIALGAGLTRGAVYWHFKDKADLFNAMMSRVTLPMEQSLERGTDAALDDPLLWLNRWCRDTLRTVLAEPRMQRVFDIATHKVEYVDELSAVRERHLSARNQCLVSLEGALGLAMRRGQLGSRLAPHAAALGLHALLDGLIRNWILDPGGFDLLRVGSQVLDNYLAGLAVPKSPALRRVRT